jgi:hypothetical protein
MTALCVAFWARFLLVLVDHVSKQCLLYAVANKRMCHLSKHESQTRLDYVAKVAVWKHNNRYRHETSVSLLRGLVIPQNKRCYKKNMSPALHCVI